MKRTAFFLVACVVAFAVPFITTEGGERVDTKEIPSWPGTFEGKVLRRIDLSSLEHSFEEAFPGRIGKFTDGTRWVIIRWVTAPTRKLHAASDCFKASGYRVKPLAMSGFRHNGERWSRFSATRGEDALVVSERIVDQSAGSWTDASSWYWAALFGKSSGPWWAYTVVERASTENGFSEHQAF
jgi:hypothetical protein